MITDDAISGNLSYVTDYTGFSGNVEYQSGHYLALKFTAAEDAVVTVELINGLVPGPVTLDEDMNIVLRITNKDTQSIKVVVTDTVGTLTKTYSLSELVLAE